MSAASTELLALAATTSAADVDRVVDRAVAEGFAAVVVPPAFARRAVGRGVAVASVVSHPHGWEKPTVKAISATSLAKDGVAALIVSPLPANLIAGDLEAYRQELLEIARGARAARASLGLAARIDLDWPGLDRATVPVIGAATIRGAFDGAVLASADLDALIAAVEAIRGVGGLTLTAIARDAAWADRLLAAGATRVGIG